MGVKPRARQYVCACACVWFVGGGCVKATCAPATARHTHAVCWQGPSTRHAPRPPNQAPHHPPYGRTALVRAPAYRPPYSPWSHLSAEVAGEVERLLKDHGDHVEEAQVPRHREGQPQQLLWGVQRGAMWREVGGRWVRRRSGGVRKRGTREGGGGSTGAGQAARRVRPCQGLPPAVCAATKAHKSSSSSKRVRVAAAECGRQTPGSVRIAAASSGAHSRGAMADRVACVRACSSGCVRQAVSLPT